MLSCAPAGDHEDEAGYAAEAGESRNARRNRPPMATFNAIVYYRRWRLEYETGKDRDIPRPRSGRRVSKLEVGTMAALDHATLLVGNLSQAALFLEERLGFRLTVTPQAPETHGRIFLDRTYVEVSSGDGRGTGEGLPLLSEWSMYFLRTADPQAFVELARDYGLQPSGPAIYHGHDGDWLDVELRASVPSYLLPGVIQRISPLAVAANWPPPLAEPHPNGAERLAAVYVLAQDKNQAEALVETLSCVAAADVAAADLQAVQWRLIPYFQAFRKSVPIADGGRVDILYASQPGLAASWLEGHGPGILAAAFATASLERTRATLVDRGYPAEEQWVGGHFLWLQPKGALGVHIGFEG